MKERYHITGMTCSACSSHVEKAVGKLAGIETVSVNLLTETMEVQYRSEELTPEEIIKAVVNAGYGASVWEKQTSATGKNDTSKAGRIKDADDKAMEETVQMKWRLGLSVVFMIPLMYVAMFHMYHNWLHIPIPKVMMMLFHGPENAMNFALTQFLLVLPILYLNRKFFTVGFRTLFRLHPNMDSLIALGATASVGYGIFAMYRIGWGLGHGDLPVVEHYMHDLYFESAGMILTLITVGKYLESRSKKKTGEAIRKLMELAPQVAILVDEQGNEYEVSTEEVRTGDIFVVKPGSLVPVDGTVLEGHSSVEEAAITGESVPVEKAPGDKVVSATINKAGFLKCRADRVGEDTTIAQMIRLVEEAGGSKAPIAKLADRVAGVFVPVVMAISLCTLLGWLAAGAEPEFAISSAIAVLVISCPCALGLATPVTIMVGTGVGAKNGILIKSGEILQSARELDTVVMDKTGTITEGSLRVMDTYGSVREASRELLLRLAAALEKKSEHPLAEAILKEAAGEQLTVPKIDGFRAFFGKGISGVLKEDVQIVPANSTLYVGNEAFLKEQDIVPSKEQTTAALDMAEEGMTPLWVACKKPEDKAGTILGIIGVADAVKDTSLEAVQAFEKMGIHTIMLTGDHVKTAEAVKRQVQIGDVIAQVLPQEKEKHIRTLKEQGHKVAMIGDGVNDAPALTTADVGMAIGAGTDIAMESADVVLMKNDLRDAVTAVALSKAVIRNIKQNLFWAFFYNSIGIPLAAGLLYPAFGLRLTPMFGAAAMSMSSIFVVTNALRLRYFKSPISTKARNVIHSEGSEDACNCQPEAETECDENRKKENETNMKKQMTIEGMMCNHCTGRVQKALEALEGVTEVVMSLEEKTATVTMQQEIADEILAKAVTDAGYEVIKTETV